MKLTTAGNRGKRFTIMKTLIPWVLVVVLIGGSAYLFSENGKKAAQIAELRGEVQEAETLRTEIAELKKSAVSNDEITRLRKEAEDVLKLRNEVRQLRDQSQQLSKQLNSTVASAQQQQQQLQKLQTQAQQAQQAQASAADINSCINNLRQIDGAIQQWALEHQKPPKSLVTAQDVTPYLKDGFPKCPAGGTYTLGTVEQIPICSIPGHALPQ